MDGSNSPFASFILGTRPEIIKLAPVIQECRERDLTCEIIHTGQHYSEKLDTVFFEQLGIPSPTHHIGVGSASHGAQTGRMIEQTESILTETEPTHVLVQGDTNSTLAGAVTTAKIQPKLGHVEAGLRSDDREMPEEVNRVLVDHAADLLFAPTEDAAQNLATEGLRDNVYVTGNTVADAVLTYRNTAADQSSVLKELGLDPDSFLLITIHRAKNVDNAERFAAILEGIDRVSQELGLPAVYPIHPRAMNRITEFDITIPESVRLIDPVDFLDFLCLEDTARLVLTDSGGVQEESCILQTHCVTLRDTTERPETVAVDANRLLGTEPDQIYEGAMTQLTGPRDWQNPFGDGTAAAQIIDIITRQASR